MVQNIHRMHAGAKAPGLTLTALLVVMANMVGKIRQPLGTEKVEIAVAVANAKRNQVETTAGASRNRQVSGLSQGEMGCSRRNY